MAKRCDNKSVGVLIEQDGRWAMVFRINYPRSWAMIAGHVDDHGSEREAVAAESLEEGGLTLGTFYPLNFREDIENPCKNEGGSHHVWTVWGAQTWAGELRASSDAKEARWMTQEELLQLAARTEYFMKKFGVPYTDVKGLIVAIFGDPSHPKEDPEWTRDPGLEPVWYYILKKLGTI